MSSTLALLEALNPENILTWLGPLALIGVAFIIFAECGLLIGFFLPGDSLLFITGLFVAQDFIETPIWVVALVLALAAVLGNAAGYWIGYKVGPKLFNRPNSRFFRQEYVDKTHEFFERYGNRALVLGRFVPIVRTFITLVAGVSRMNPRRFFTWSAVGAVIWVVLVTLAGYFLGNIPFIKNNLEAAILLIVGVSVLPMVFEWWRHRQAAATDDAKA